MLTTLRVAISAWFVGSAAGFFAPLTHHGLYRAAFKLQAFERAMWEDQFLLICDKEEKVSCGALKEYNVVKKLMAMGKIDLSDVYKIFEEVPKEGDELDERGFVDFMQGIDKRVHPRDYMQDNDDDEDDREPAPERRLFGENSA